MKVKRWSRPASIAFSILFIAVLCFTLLPLPVQIPFGGAGVARADTEVTLNANMDNTLSAGAATTNYGTSTSLYVNTNTSWIYRSILEFTHTIPTNATITSAVLSLSYESLCYLCNDPVGRTYWAYRLTETDWNETTSTWNVHKTSNNWVAAGGDYTATDGASATMPSASGLPKWVTWTITAQVQTAVTAGTAIEVLIKDGTETGDVGASFSSNNHATASLRPKLVVTYTEPPLTISTLAATSITSTSATLNGNVTSLGSYGNVTQYGFVLSTSTQTNPGNVSPTLQTKYLTGNWTWTGVQYAAGTTFTSNGNVTGLSSPNTYYFRAAGYSTYGWAYGEEASFSIGILSIQPPTDDARVNIDVPTTNYGNDDLMCLRPGNGIINTQRSLVSFSTSSIPDGVTIISATLSVYLVSYYLVDLSGLHVLCQRTTSAWSEGTVTWNTQPTVTDTNQAETTLPNDPAWMEFTGAQVLALAQYAVANGDVFSALIRLETESGSDSMPTFATSEYATENLRPKLVVTYEYTPGVSNTPADKGLGIVLPNTYYWGKSGTQVGPSSWPLEDTDSIGNITNPTGFAINVLFSMSSMAGGITWNPGTTPGANVFVVKVGMSGVTNEAGMTKLSTTPQKLITNLPGGDHIHWEFVFYTPTNLITNNDSTEHTGYLTVAAEAY